MKCPIDHHDVSLVLRTEHDEDRIRRRRQCARCGHKWWTTERIEAELERDLQKLAQIRQTLAEGV